MEASDEQVTVPGPQMSAEPVLRESSTRGSHRFGSLSHHSFFSRHNPHPHRVRHMQGLNGKPVCTVNDDWYGFTPLCPHPLIKSQVCVSGSPSSAFLTAEIGSGAPAALVSESWREELKDLATKVSVLPETHDKRESKKASDEEAPRRKTQYSSQSGRIIPASSWGGKRRSSRTAHRRTAPQRWRTLEGEELRVLELLCQILQTDSFSMVKQWLLLASDREKELVQGLIRQAMCDSASCSHSSVSPLLPLTAEDLPDHVFIDASVRRRTTSPQVFQDKPERIGEAEVLTLCPEDT